MMASVVAVMVCAPSLTGKSRLIHELGIRDGTGLRLALLRDTLESVSSLDAEKAILFTPPAGETEIRALTPFPAVFLPQRGTTLGDRMREGGRELVAHGFDGVVLIGSDLPTLPTTHVSAALEWLTRRRDGVVLGPSEDGGYYLIGLTRWPAQLFEHIPWGTPLVLKRTLEVASTLGMPVELLPVWYDVDSARDLRRVWRASETRNGPGRHTRAWLAAAGPAVQAHVETDEM
jgi:rSAM/selenodomain-associated transferase 1